MSEAARHPASPVLPGATRLFGDRMPIAVAYADLLATAGVQRGLIGPREVDRIWPRHLVNSAALGAELSPGDRIADVGSGAGLPGLVIAIVRPDVRVTLIEPLLRRYTFLVEAAGELGLGNVEVRRVRAEDAKDLRGTFDVVTARAVAPLDRLLGWCLPLLRPEGRLLAIKGASAAEEVQAAEAVLRGLRGGAPAIRQVGPPESPTTVVEVLAPPGRRRTRSA